MANVQATQVTGAVSTTGNTTETNMINSNIVNPTQITPPGLGTRIRGTLNFTPGTGATSITLRCRQGGGVPGAAAGAGTVVGNALVIGVTAAVLIQIPFDFLDASAAFGLLAALSQWTITIQQTGASANGTMNQGNIETSAATAVS